DCAIASRAPPEQCNSGCRQQKARETSEPGAPYNPLRNRLPGIGEITGSQAENTDTNEPDGEKHVAQSNHACISSLSFDRTCLIRILGRSDVQFVVHDRSRNLQSSKRPNGSAITTSRRCL